MLGLAMITANQMEVVQSNENPFGTKIGTNTISVDCKTTYKSMIFLRVVVLAERLELPTARLQIGCSTN